MVNTPAPPTLPTAPATGIGGFFGVVMTVAIVGGTFFFFSQIFMRTQGMQTESIQRFEQLLADEASNAINNARYRYSCNRNFTQCNLSFTADRNYTCASGGRIHTSGTWGGPITPSYSKLTVNMTQTITDWSCITPWVINGDPYVSYRGDMNASRSGAGNFNFYGSGGWIGQNPNGNTQSCQTKSNMNYSNQTGGVFNVNSNCVPGGSIIYNGTI